MRKEAQERRGRSLRMRLSDEEYGTLEEAADKLGVSMTEAVRRMARAVANDEVPVRNARPVIDAGAAERKAIRENLDAIDRELRRQGANLNQVARALNIATRDGEARMSGLAIVSALKSAGVTPSTTDALGLLHEIARGYHTVAKRQEEVARNAGN